MSQASNTDLEKNATEHYEGRPLTHVVTPGGNPADYSQPALPQYHRKVANPAPLGLVSFAAGYWLASVLTLSARGVEIPNVVVPVLALFGGLMQTIVGLVEMFLGNTWGATVFCSFGSFNFTYAALYLPAFGVAQAYLRSDGTLDPSFNQAVGLYLLMWVLVDGSFVIGALRTSVSVLSTLVFTFLNFVTLAVWKLDGSDAARIVGGVFGLCASACATWGAAAGFYTNDATFGFLQPSPINLRRD
ncbi:hypothetical protein JCM10296v2_002105 [Rhodotorula toruloides]